MVFHIKINQRDYDVQSDSTANAIKLALDTFLAEQQDDPDVEDIDFSTQGLEVVGEYANELTTSP